MRSLKALLLIASISSLFRFTTSSDHTVGGQDSGWDIGVDIQSWGNTEKFYIGDTLTFSYQVYHDVLEVSKQNFETCTTTNAFARYTGGSTTIKIADSGTSYFICGIPRHCTSGMKLEVDVLPSASLSPPLSSPPPPSPPVYSPPPPTTSPPPPPIYSPPPPTASPPPPPSPIYSSPPPPTPIYSSSPPPFYSSPQFVSSPPPPTPVYSSPSPPVISSSPPQTPIYASPPPPTTFPPQQLPTYSYSSPPPPFSPSPPAPAPKHHTHKKPHPGPAKEPKHAAAAAPAPAPAPASTVYKLSMNYVAREGSELGTSEVPAKNQSRNFVVGIVLAMLMLLVL